MSLLQVIPIVKPNSKAVERFKKCLTCPEKKRFMNANWCGTPIAGSTALNDEFEEVKLCGCNCKLKSKVDEEHCPLDRWP